MNPTVYLYHGCSYGYYEIRSIVEGDGRESDEAVQVPRRVWVVLDENLLQVSAFRRSPSRPTTAHPLLCGRPCGSTIWAETKNFIRFS